MGIRRSSRPTSASRYCNGGYVVLALIAERASGTPFHELVRERVCEPAGMLDTAFLRSDELPGRTALGYLDSKALAHEHLPPAGARHGDGGIYTTAADLARALERVLRRPDRARPTGSREMVRPRSDVPEESARYGLGFWLHASTDAVRISGGDAGVSCYSVHDRRHDAHVHGAVSNTTGGAWPIARLLSDRATG